MQAKTIAILGTGAWGTALASLAARNGHPLRLWSRRGSERLEDVIDGISVVVSAVSMSWVSSVIAQLQNVISADTIIVTSTKGLDPATSRTPSQIWQAAFP